MKNRLLTVCWLSLIIFMDCQYVYAKVLLLTFVHSRPDFIELHVKTFKAFLQDDYEYVVFNDAANEAMDKQIREVCAMLGVRCFRVPAHVGRRNEIASFRHIDGIQYALNILGFDFDGIVGLVDADMFLITPMSIEKYMDRYDVIGGYQMKNGDHHEVVYTSPCLVFMDMRTLPNKHSLSFELGFVDGVATDVGGYTYYYFKDNPTLKLRYYVAKSKQTLPRDAAALRQLGYDDQLIKFLDKVDEFHGFEFHGDRNFIHYYAGGSNWPGYSQQWIEDKNHELNELIDERIHMFSCGG